MLVGGLLAAAYIFKVLGHTFTQADISHEPVAVPASKEWAALLLAMGAVLLGFLASPIFSLLDIGNAFSLNGVSP